MPRLYVLSGPDVGRTFSVRSGDTLGRSPDRILTLRHASVSRRHAHFEEQEGVWYVVDDGSQNGVLVGGERVARAALHDAAEFALGEILLRFRLDAPAARPCQRRARRRSRTRSSSTARRSCRTSRPAHARARRSRRRRPGPARAGAPRARARNQRPRPIRCRPEGPAVPPRRGSRGFCRERPRQHPTWLRVLIVTCVLALGVAIAYFAFRGAIFVKGEVGGAP